MRYPQAMRSSDPVPVCAHKSMVRAIVPYDKMALLNMEEDGVYKELSKMGYLLDKADFY